MKIKGAIFDMDGTIVDSLMFWNYLWRRIGEKYMNDPEFKPSEDIDKELRTMVFVDGMAYFRERYGILEDGDEFFDFACSGIDDFYKNVVKVKKGAVELLQYLKNNGIRLCLASGTEMKTVLVALEHHNLKQYFDFVMSCADIGVGKDKPDIYINAMNALGFEKEEICVFEDSFVALETAKGVGFKTVGIFDKYNFEQGRLRKASDIYVGEGQSLAILNEKIERS